MKPQVLVDPFKAGLCGTSKLRPPRDFARLCAKEGVAYMAKALNMCDNPGLPYRYSKAVRDRFMQIASELCELIETGAILELPHIAARADPAFQQFMAAALVPPKKPRRKRPSP